MTLGEKTRAPPANEPDCLVLAVVQTALNTLTHATFSESQGVFVDSPNKSQSPKK